ncbi:protein msta isoform X2 [Eurytemora carolleeae]|nr:protein msta isoform X2 [Eurytemora carolleeae]|eukprot:XP_023343481.1 protein msta-like isoform X2 [Eurytemora affinis]
MEGDLTLCFLCGKPSSDTCSYCLQVGYCSKYHLSKHRAQDRCLPFRVEVNQEKGRYVVATRDIAPLELVILDTPGSIGPKQFTKPVCLSCLSPVSGEFSCSSCNYPMCSQECAENVIHTQGECNIFPRFPDIKDYSTVQPQYECIAPLRLILNKNKDPLLWDMIKLHKDHTQDRIRINPQLVQEESYKITGLLLQFCNLSGAGFTEQDIIFSSSVLATHAVSVGENGRGFYPVFAFMSHSCTYNARHVIDESNCIRVYSQTQIKQGEEICITYTSLLSCTSHRQEKLRNLWFFSCTCARCSDPTELGTYISSVSCPSCPNNGYLVLEKDAWKCGECSLKVSESLVSSLLQSTRDIMGNSQNGIEKHEHFLNQTKQLLHPNNYQVLITERILSQLYGRGEDKVPREDLLRKIGLCKHLLSIIEILDPGFSQFRG